MNSWGIEVAYVKICSQASCQYIIPKMHHGTIRKIPSPIEQWFSKYGNRRSSISITCEPIRAANPQAPPWTYWLRNSGGGARQSVFQVTAVILMIATATHLVSKIAPNVCVSNIRVCCKYVCRLVLNPLLQMVNICFREDRKSPHGSPCCPGHSTLGTLSWPFPLMGALPPPPHPTPYRTWLKCHHLSKATLYPWFPFTCSLFPKYFALLKIYIIHLLM